MPPPATTGTRHRHRLGHPPPRHGPSPRRPVFFPAGALPLAIGGVDLPVAG
ncbi:hypothetical protein ACH4TV_14905 [Streptomyces sp. NPDC020898]|uniref:hypothetical protein n=1 Tax=Streptomyces sp. NPDC020898 TaxID=3365101 RepID=UPI0037B8E2C4